MKRLVALLMVVCLTGTAAGAKIILGGGRTVIRVAPTTPVAKPAVSPKPVRIELKPGQCLVELREGLRIVGTPDELAVLPVTTSFGAVEIPLATIKQIRSGKQPGRVKIEFSNGDRLTCDLRVGRMTLKSDYGTFTVPAADIARVAFGKSVTVSPDDVDVASVATRPSS
jgi:hypothetical protein